MGSPILKIPVDDTAFKRFMETFDKYQDALGEQPEMWKGVDDSVRSVAAAGAAMSAEIAHQAESTRKLAQEEAARAKVQSDAARQRKKEQDDARKADQDAARRRKESIDQVREYGRNLTNIAGSLGKWGGGGVGGVTSAMSSAGSAASSIGGSGFLGGLAGAVMGPVGLALGLSAAAIGGSYLLANSAGQRQRSASGLGVSAGKLQGYELNLGQYVDVDALLGNLSAAQNDPSQWSKFAMMGISNPRGKGPDELMQESILSARRMYKSNPILAQQQLSGMFSPQDLRRLGSTSESDIRKAFAASEKFSKESGVDADIGKKMQQLAIDIDTAGAKMQNVLVKGLSAMDAPLTDAVKGMGAFADDLKVIVPYLDKIAGWVTGKTIKHELKDMVTVHHGDDKPTPPDAFHKYFWDPANKVAGGIGAWASKEFGSWFGNSLADRNNNPGNIMHGGRYASFPTKQAGFEAMAKQLLIDYNKHGQHTVYSLINDPHHGWSNEWAPGNSHESTMNYIRSVSRALGVDANQNINVNDDTTLRKLIAAMYAVERGGRGSQAHRGATHHIPRANVAVHHKVTVENKTGSSVAVTANSMAGG